MVAMSETLSVGFAGVSICTRGVGAKRRAYVLGIGGIHDGGFDAVLLRQNLVQQAVGGDIGGVGEDRVVASVEERGERGGQRGHAGSEHHRILGTFKTGQLFFQIALVRMAVARCKGSRPNWTS